MLDSKEPSQNWYERLHNAIGWTAFIIFALLMPLGPTVLNNETPLAMRGLWVFLVLLWAALACKGLLFRSSGKIRG